MNVEDQDELALTGMPAGELCEHCQAPHSGIGGRKDGRFFPLFQEKLDRIAAAKMIGKLAYCGRDHREHMLRIRRIVCTFVDAGDGTKVFACQRCARDISKALAEEGAAA